MVLTGLQEKMENLADEHHVPGVAVGIFCDGEEHYACHGVTSVENPLAVEPIWNSVDGPTASGFSTEVTPWQA